VPGALQALRKACEQGDARGCSELGFLRLRESGDDTALAEAYTAHERGCKLESASGCVGAATQAHYGLGTPATPDAAREQLAHWCERGNPDACNASRGYFAALRPLLTAGSGKSPAAMPTAPINALELRPANVAGVARVGYCLDGQGRVERAELLDSTGAPALDDQILAHVKTWQLAPRPFGPGGSAPGLAAPTCSVHEQRVVFTFRSTGSRPFFTAWESWQTARGGTLLLDLDPLR
jgi:TonB family protein